MKTSSSQEEFLKNQAEVLDLLKIRIQYLGYDTTKANGVGKYKTNQMINMALKLIENNMDIVTYVYIGLLTLLIIMYIKSNLS